MKNKNGFTLIELLAVIVILAIIALIATPMITNVIDTARRGAAESSALGYVDSVEKASIIALINQESLTGTYNVSELTNEISLKGDAPSKGEVVIADSGSVTNATLCINNYKINYDGSTATILENNCDDMSEFVEPIYTVYADGTPIFFNPETGLVCNESETASTTETKTGCMKWYTFGDEGKSSDKIDLLLDHNTTALVEWNSSSSNVNGPNEALVKLKSDTNSWDVSLTRSDSYSLNNGIADYTIDYSTYKARLITADEIANITENDLFLELVALNTDWYFLDSNNQIQSVNTIGASNFDWLFNYTNECTYDGCSVNDSSTYGFWTATATAGDFTRAWMVYRDGNLTSGGVDYNGNRGIRPVITVSKSKL